MVIQKPIVFDTLAQTASPEGRRETAAKLHRDLIKLNCEFADTQARELHEYDSSMTSPGEAKRIVQCAVEIYSTLIEFYQRSPSASTNGLQGTEASPNSPPAGLSAADTIELSK
ncbi:MAG: hypothetical protein WBD47_06840 [Phormidesmis sp.]